MIPSSVLQRFLAPLVCLLFAVAIASCTGGPEISRHPAPIDDSSSIKSTIYVTSNGWHSGIVIKKDNLPPETIPEARDFPEALFLEFGWGDAEFYPAKEATIGMTLSAALVPTDAVLHVAGLNVSPDIRYPDDEVIPLSINVEGLYRLINFIDASFDRGEEERAASTGQGLHANSFFYPARGRFHMFNTCNTWSARALASAGFSIREKGTHSAEALMSQVRLLGRSSTE